MLKIWPFGKKSLSALDVWKDIAAGFATKSGQSVTLTTALRVSAVFGCIRVVSEDIGQVPFKLYQKKDRMREPAEQHPLYDVLFRKPNDYMTAFEFRETLIMHAMLCQGGYAFINRVGSERRVAELLPIDPGCVEVLKPERLGDSPRYRITGKNGEKRDFPAESIFRLKGPSWDGFSGMEVLKIAREALGLSIAAESSHARIHANGSRTSGIYSVDGSLSSDQYKQLRSWIAENFEGADNAGKVALLDRGAKFIPTAMTGADAQHLETRRFQIEETCRYFRVMPIMIGYSDKAATYASAEQMFLAHVVHTLAPWFGRFEQAVDCQLLTDNERRKQGFYSKFTEEGLLRGALKDTAEHLTKLTTNGIMTRNEARAKLDMNPLDGLDDPLTPANMSIGGASDENPGSKE